MKYAARDNSFENIYSGKYNTRFTPLQMALSAMQLYEKIKFDAKPFTNLAVSFSYLSIFLYFLLYFLDIFSFSEISVHRHLFLLTFVYQRGPHGLR